ncbi:tricalbin [Cantharellus anzutake]|uniref:tricalbin n=1 Tax=Cantharellus anzutake TaxID=1750568 RepID=UPI001907A326|nr:tricalbin [Cantharellus anzutake]KAF8342603.1 tricalbin [Cantharellus anzutake]
MAEPVARGTLDAVHARDEDLGGKVHTFNPDASPEQKAALAGQAKGQLSSVTNGAPKEARGIKLDTGGPPVQPTIKVEDIDESIGDGEKKAETTPPKITEQPIPGALPDGPAYAIPDWYRVGWRAVSGIDRPVADGEERDRHIISMFIDDMYYGQWYHNAGIIVFAVVTTYFLTVFRFGWGWLFIVLAVCATYYSTSMRRLRRAARDDIQRELIKNRLASEHESADWLNNFLDRFWLIYEPILSSTIVSSVDQVLSISTPTGVDSMRLSTFTLGTKAPRIDKVRTFPRTADDIVLMDWAISFNSSDLADSTSLQLVNKVNSKIVLEIRIGRGVATAGMHILVENIVFSGEMRVKLKLMTNYPHIQIAEISFLQPPVLDYSLKPIGGDTFGFDINNIPGLSSFIRDQVHATLGPMMYDPNVFTLNLEQMLSGTPLDSATGVLQIKITSARDLKAVKFGGGVPDPYVSLSIEHRVELARTRFKRSSPNPHFGSTHYLLLNSTNLHETLTLSVLDHNDHRNDTELGTASYELSQLLDDATREGIIVKVLKDGKECGEVIFDLSYFPVLTPAKGPDGQLEPVPETSVGIVRLILHQAKELDLSKALTRDLNPFAKVLLHHQLIHKTPTFRHTASPVWESAAEFLVSDRSSCVIAVKIADERDMLKDPVIGFLSVRLDDLLKAKEQQRDWFPLSGCKTGKLRMSAEWKPLAMAGSVQGAAAYTPPIGVVRLWIKEASDVKNVEAALGGKSDPYIRVQMNGITLARTEVINNNLNPKWDAIVYVPVHALSDVMVLEAMDYQNLTKDRTLGYCELAVKDLAKQNAEDMKYPFAPIAKLEREASIRLQGNTFKGKLHYAAEFVPALNLAGTTFPAAGTELDDSAPRDGSGEDIASGDESSSDEESLDGITIAPSYSLKDDVPTSPTTANGDGSAKEKAHRKKGSVDSTRSTGTAAAAKKSETMPPVPEQVGVELSQEELLKQQSGVLAVNAISGELCKKARLELLVDESYWPSFSTERARSTTARWDQVGEGFIRELDFGRVWLRLNENEEGMKDDIIGDFKIEAKAFLEQCLGKEAEFILTDQNSRRTSKVKLMAKYIPVPVTLEPRESITNMGLLRVDVLGARDLLAADRGGTSDPYAIFTLNDQKVYKTEKKMKTLTPTWDENFTVPVPSRVAAQFKVEVKDWDQLGNDDPLGFATINLADLEPFESTERTLSLQTPKGTKGTITIKMVFNPEIVARTRKNTSTFIAAGRAMTQVGGLPFSAIKGTAHGVGAVGSKTFGLLRKNKTIEESDELPVPASAVVPEIPSTPFSQPAVTDALAASGATSYPIVDASGKGTPPTEFGTLRVTVVSAKGLVGAAAGDGVKPYVSIKVGKKEHQTKHVHKALTPEWNEQFVFTVGPDNQTISLALLDHKTLAKDKVLADAEIQIWQHIRLGATPVLSSDVWAELRNGSGLIQLRLDYEKASSTNGSLASHPRTPLSSPSRFNLSRRTATTPSQDD